MKNETYAILNETPDGTLHEKHFKTKEEAIQEARWDWNKYLTKEEKRKMRYYAVVKGELDETGYMDFDGVTEVIIVFKAYEN